MSSAYRLLLAGIVVLGAAYWYNERVCACSVKWKMYRAAAKGDLRRLSAAEAEEFARDSTYTIRLDSLDEPDFTYTHGPLRGQHVRFGTFSEAAVHVEVTWAGKSGWRAVARHDALDGECAIFVGVVPLPPRVAGAALREGEPACDMREKQ